MIFQMAEGKSDLFPINEETIRVRLCPPARVLILFIIMSAFVVKDVFSRVFIYK